ncbi:MAG: hypothetical protein PHT07_15145 [Paludibacter sp.]|nr:hypothetical protein [Paludibacter sp.]
MDRKLFGKGFGFSGGGSGGSGGGSLVNPITTTVPYLPGIPLGTNYPAGTLLETIFDDLLAPYIEPIMSGLSITLNPNTSFIEVGNVADVVSAAWSVVNDSLGNPPQNMNLAGDGFNVPVTGTSQVATPGSTTFLNAPGAKTWTLSGEDIHAAPIASVTFQKFWRWRFAFGAVNSADPTDDASASALVLALQQFQLLASKVATFICTADNNTAGNFTWIAYPASFGALSNIIQNGALPVLTAFTAMSNFNVTNTYGQVVAYRFYKSNSDAAFAAGVSLAIS